jgi:hypothetical protein
MCLAFHQHSEHARGHYPEVLAGDVTPEDYLAKIFNVPLILPGLTAGGLRRMLADLTATTPGATTEASGPHVETTTSAPDQPPAAPPILEIAPHHRVPVGAGPLFPAPRPLSAAELRILESLESLIDSPRRAKRLLNLYRRLRSTDVLADAVRFLGEDGRPGEYQAVVVLLGLLIAHPDLLAPVLDSRPGGLMHRGPAGRWADFAAGLAPAREDHGWRNVVVGELDPAAVPRWERLADGIRPASDLVEFDDLTAFRLWAPRIRRFSFVV